MIGADGITLNLNGHRIFGTPSPGDGIGVHVLGRRGVTVTNRTVSDFDAGVVIEGGRANRVRQLTARDNIGSEETFFGDGISILGGSTGNIVEDNLVTNNGPFTGVAIGEFEGAVSSTFNTIRRNVIVDNNVPFNAEIQFTAGIALIDVVSGTTITGNYVARNGFHGITLDGPFVTRNVVYNNTVEDNGFHEQANRKGDGIRIEFEANGNVVTANRVLRNAANGIATTLGSVANRIAGNTALDNNVLGIEGAFDLLDENPDCDANLWQGNEFGTAFPECAQG